jgi:hypothetical protein
MSFFLGTTRVLLPCSFVAPTIEATAAIFRRVVLRSEGRKTSRSQYPATGFLSSQKIRQSPETISFLAQQARAES